MSNQSVLLLWLAFGHLAADYTWLSTPEMLSAKRAGKPVGPIAFHGAVHAALVGVVLFGFDVPVLAAIYSMTFMFVTHTIIDILKGRLQASSDKLSQPTNVEHWVLFGFDQYLHLVVLVLISDYLT